MARMVGQTVKARIENREWKIEKNHLILPILDPLSSILEFSPSFFWLAFLFLC
jgi:hypothetical protein